MGVKRPRLNRTEKTNGLRLLSTSSDVARSDYSIKARLDSQLNSRALLIWNKNNCSLPRPALLCRRLSLRLRHGAGFRLDEVFQVARRD
jgi:hypothetical protein